MLIVSCGTLDLIERVLTYAGVKDSFRIVGGNRFRIKNGKIKGMELQLLSPDDKLKAIKKLGFLPGESVAIGDGYTDLPLLDWAGIPFLLDRSGTKKDKYSGKKYHFISSIPEIAERIGTGDWS